MQMVKKDLHAFKEEMKSPKRGSGSTVCSEASLKWVWEALAHLPGLRLLLLGSMTSSSQERWKKGWVTDYKQCSNQGLTDTEVSDFIRDLQKMLPDPDQKYIDWDQTKTE